MGFQANVFEFKMTFPFGFLGGCWYLEIWRWKWHEMKSGVGYDLEVFQKWMGNTCFSYGPFWTRCHYVALQNDQVSFMSLWFVYYICLHMVPMVSMVQKQPQRFNDLKIFLCLLLAILQLPEGWFRSNQHAATRDGTHRTAVNINLGNAPSMYPFRAEFTKHIIVIIWVCLLAFFLILWFFIDWLWSLVANTWFIGISVVTFPAFATLPLNVEWKISISDRG